MIVVPDQVKSFGYRTDLIILGLKGSSIDRRDGYRIIRTPRNPTFHWRNFVLLDAVLDEIALIGYDDISFASGSVVALSSVRQPSTRIGAEAVDILLAEAADPERAPVHLVFQPELVIRDSTRPA